MPLTPIGDIASAAITEEQVVVWETAADWNAAVEEEYVEHANDVVGLTEGADSFEDNMPSSGLPAPWSAPTSVQQDTSRALDGSRSVKSTSGGDFWGRTFAADRTPSQIEYSYNEENNSNGHHFAVLHDGDYLFGAGTGNPQSFYIGGGSGTDTVSTFEHDYDEWVTYTFTNIDFQAGTFDVDMVTETSGSYSDTGATFNNSAPGISSVELGDNTFDAAGGIQSVYHDLVWGTITDGSLLTATKSFPFLTEPDVQGLDYTLNGGGVTIEIIGSPNDGSKEVKTRVLDGSTTYSLSWGQPHTDFRVRIISSSPSRDVSGPTVSRIGLGGVPS
jgi:hypothetical protein